MSHGGTTTVHAQQQTLKPRPRGALYLLRSFVNMLASWVYLKLQTKPRGCVDSAVLLCDNAS